MYFNHCKLKDATSKEEIARKEESKKPAAKEWIQYEGIVLYEKDKKEIVDSGKLGHETCWKNPDLAWMQSTLVIANIIHRHSLWDGVIANILKSASIQFVKTPKQSGGRDCAWGLMLLPSQLHGLDPEVIKFKQDTFRHHLVLCKSFTISCCNDWLVQSVSQYNLLFKTINHCPLIVIKLFCFI